MLKEWQFNVLFWVAVGGTVFILVAPAVGLKQVAANPGAVGGIGVILTYVLSQKSSIVKKKDDKGSPEGDDKDGS